jgi:hypothetical protein
MRMRSFLFAAAHEQGSVLSYLTSSSSAALLGFLALQILFAVIVTVASVILLPSTYRWQRLSTSAYLFALSVSVPCGGLLICVVALCLAHRFPLKEEVQGVIEVGWPVFESSLVERIKHGEGGRLRIQLDNVNAPVSQRMTALLAMQTMPKRTASPILRGLLRDSVEDVRLLMYGMLDGAEKDITQQIHAELPKLEALRDDDDEARYAVHARLAQFYWELIYQNLVQDDIYLYTADQADHYAKVALEIKPDNASLWYMRGRLALTRSRPEEAAAFLERAAQTGFPSVRLSPFVAECAYLRKNYATVREALSGFENRSTLPFLQSLQRYWNS